MRQRPADLEPQEWERPARVFTCSPKVEAVYHLWEDLTEMFKRDDTKAGAKCVIRAWGTRVHESELAEFERFLGMIDQGRGLITNSCQDRQTSGFVEGFNTRVKVLKRRCDGIFDVGRLFQWLTLDLRMRRHTVATSQPQPVQMNTNETIGGRRSQAVK